MTQVLEAKGSSHQLTTISFSSGVSVVLDRPAATLGGLVRLNSSASAGNERLVSKRSAVSPTQQGKIDAAVYQHLRAVRALGVTEVNSASIGAALGLPAREVEKSLRRLQGKGVKARR